MNEASTMVTVGLEEEVFVLEKNRIIPTLQSLDYLRRLYWANPKKYGAHCASNFSKGEDRKQCFMGSIEIATSVHTSAASLLEDLLERRREMALACAGGLVVPVGGLFSLSSPTNTASSHIHVGVPKSERDRVYNNLAYFAPVLAVAAANSPWANGEPFGLSYRMHVEGLLGPLREDREYRFQDIIISKRLGTIELRIFDPIPQLDRLECVLNAIIEIAKSPANYKFSRDDYNRERPGWTKSGANEFIRRRWSELQDFAKLPVELLEHTLSDDLSEIASKNSILAAYEHADSIWRAPTGVPRELRAGSKTRTLAGLTGFYALRLPFIAYKGYKEWYGKA